MSNKNPQMNKGHVAPMPNNMSPIGVAQPNFMNFPNQQQIPFQNNQPGMPHLVPNIPMFQGQYPIGFGPQNTVPNNMVNVPQQFNQNPYGEYTVQFPRPFFNMGLNGNQANMPQLPGQMPTNNMVNVPQHVNQNPYGQYTVQFPMQHMNQINPMQMLNPFVPMFPNQMNQAMGAMNHGFNPNLQLSQHGNPNMQNVARPSMDVNAPFHQPTQNQQSQLNLSAPSTHQSVQSPQTNINVQHRRPQDNHVEGGRNDFSKSNGNKFNKQNFNRNSKGDKSHSRFQQSQSLHTKNSKRQFGSSGPGRGNGYSNDRSGVFGQTTNHARVQEKRSTSVNYTEQEIQQWRSERKKSYPSKANMNKKLTENITKTGAIDSEAKLRRMRLKEILAKQAELGVEVAEIPPQYLSDSENQIHRRNNIKNGPNNERFKNKRNNSKQRRNYERDLFRKKQKYGDSSDETLSSTREPTLLQKLLSSEIKRDKSHLLQVFRFMVMNSFFKDAPDKPLAFPVVTLNHTELEAIDETLIEELDDQSSEEDEEGEITP